MPLALRIALLIPDQLPSGEPFPDRELIIAVTALGMVTSQLVQSATMQPLLRAMRAVDDPAGWQEETVARRAAAEAAVEELDRVRRPGDAISQRVLDRCHAEARDAEPRRAGADRSVQDPYQIALGAKRRALIRLHERNTIGGDVYRRLLDEVDLTAEATDAWGTDGAPD